MKFLLSVEKSYHRISQTYEQPAVNKDGRTLVPLRGIFETLGAEVLWDNDTRSVTATKGDTIIELTLDQKTVYVNGKPTELEVEAQLINERTMVPLRFVSEALGAEVAWDTPTFTASITSAPTTEVKPVEENTQVVNGIKVLYGKHTYETKNQKEYDAVMEIVHKALEGVEDIKFSNGEYDYNPYYYAYIAGERANKEDRNSKDPDKYLAFRALTQAHNRIGELVEAGVSTPDILKVVQAGTVAARLVSGAPDLGQASRSAHDLLVSGQGDCDAIANVYSAVLDAMGYNTLILAGAGQADPYVEIQG